MSSPGFQAAYQKLNPEQKLAVDTIEGCVMVIAGPGTGKTQVLATRIAQILLETDQKPQNILALTFTDAAAQNMRERIVSLIGTDGYSVGVMTFHGFASEVIAAYPEKFPIERGSEPLSDFERFEIFETIILNSDLQILKPLNSQLYYIREVIKRISDLKREYISPDKLETILQAEKTQLEEEIAQYWEAQELAVENGKKARKTLSAQLVKQQKNLEKQKELHLLYVKYAAELKNRKRYDFDDMILFVISAFETDEELLLDYQERFQYILVDEYQDTNAAQNRIVELLGSFWEENPNIFVVGDPHQSVFRFQGASTENMLQFVSKYPETTLITLTMGYRCHQEIYTGAHTLISNNVSDFKIQGTADQKKLNQALTEKLQSAKGPDTCITTFAADSEAVELMFVVEEIKKLQSKGVSLEEIAILYRNNAEAKLLQEFLEKWDIAYEISVGGNALEDLLVQQLLNFLHCLKELALGVDTPLLFEVMQYSWLGLERVSVYKVARIAGSLHKTITEVLELTYTQITENYGLTEPAFNELVLFKQKAAQWYHYSKNMLFHEWFSLLLSIDNSKLTKEGEEKKPDGFGFMEFVLSKPVKIDHLFAINSMFTVVKQLVHTKRLFNLDDFLQRVTIMQEHNLSIKIRACSISKNRVALSTVHSAKGKEWKYVFIISAVDKKWGNGMSRDLLPLPDSILTNVDISQKEKNEDERRLFYVAITRASKKAYISWSSVRADGKDLLHSMFITELAEHAQPISQNQSAQLTRKSEKLLEDFLTTAITPQQKYTAQETEFFTQLVSEFKLSVTALNNYLKDPHEFLINSLLRVPRAKSPVLSFGTAVHFALEKFYTSLQSGQVLSQQDLQQQFEYALQNEFLSENDFIQRRQHGLEVLEFYYGEVLSNVLSSKNTADFLEHTAPLFIEKFFGGKLNQTILIDEKKEIKLSGRMDRVDILDKTQKTVRVIDYKTGSQKSEAVIFGKSGTSDYSERELSLPETIRGRLQRQMVFYKLLAQLDKTFGYNVAEVEFDFVEPAGLHKDKHITRRFEVSQEAVADLKVLIITVMKEIRELQFLK